MKVVQMEVTVTVTPPKGMEIDDQEAIELAMQAVTQHQQVQCGIETDPKLITWADVYAEVSDADCEVIE